MNNIYINYFAMIFYLLSREKYFPEIMNRAAWVALWPLSELNCGGGARGEKYFPEIVNRAARVALWPLSELNCRGGARGREVGAELRSLGHQRAALHWWRDSQNHATNEERLFGGQGSRAPLPPPSYLRPYRYQSKIDPRDNQIAF